MFRTLVCGTLLSYVAGVTFGQQSSPVATLSDFGVQGYDAKSSQWKGQHAHLLKQVATAHTLEDLRAVVVDWLDTTGRDIKEETVLDDLVAQVQQWKEKNERLVRELEGGDVEPIDASEEHESNRFEMMMQLANVKTPAEFVDLTDEWGQASNMTSEQMVSFRKKVAEFFDAHQYLRPSAQPVATLAPSTSSAATSPSPPRVNQKEPSEDKSSLPTEMNDATVAKRAIELKMFIEGWEDSILASTTLPTLMEDDEDGMMTSARTTTGVPEPQPAPRIVSSEDEGMMTSALLDETTTGVPEPQPAPRIVSSEDGVEDGMMTRSPLDETTTIDETITGVPEPQPAPRIVSSEDEGGEDGMMTRSPLDETTTIDEATTGFPHPQPVPRIVSSEDEGGEDGALALDEATTGVPEPDVTTRYSTISEDVITTGAPQPVPQPFPPFSPRIVASQQEGQGAEVVARVRVDREADIVLQVDFGESRNLRGNARL